MIPVHRFLDPLAGWRLRLQDAPKGEGVLRRVVAGLAWPRGTKPGAVVALGERLHPLPRLAIHEVLILAHVEHADPAALFLAARTIGDACLVLEFVGDTASPFMARLEQFDDGLRRRKRPIIGMEKAPLVGQAGRFSGYADLLRARVAATKTMSFGPQFQDLARAVMAITPEEELRAQPEHHPGPCALFYALAEIDLNQPVLHRQSKLRRGDRRAGY